MSNSMVELDLSNIGELNREVRALIPSLVNSLDDDKSKSKLNITIEFKRMKDSETAIVTGYSLKPVYPKRAQNILCRRDLVGNLHTEADSFRQMNLPLHEDNKQEA